MCNISGPQRSVSSCFWHYLQNESCHQHRPSLLFRTQHPLAAQLPTWQLTDILGSLKSLNKITAFSPPFGFLVKSFVTKEMYLHWARSGFKCESPIHFWAWNCNACYKTPGNVITILDGFVNLRRATVYIVTSVFPTATSRIARGELYWNLMFENFSEFCGEN